MNFKKISILSGGVLILGLGLGCSPQNQGLRYSFNTGLPVQSAAKIDASATCSQDRVSNINIADESTWDRLDQVFGKYISATGDVRYGQLLSAKEDIDFICSYFAASNQVDLNLLQPEIASAIMMNSQSLLALYYVGAQYKSTLGLSTDYLPFQKSVLNIKAPFKGSDGQVQTGWDDIIIDGFKSKLTLNSMMMMAETFVGMKAVLYHFNDGTKSSSGQINQAIRPSNFSLLKSVRQKIISENKVIELDLSDKEFPFVVLSERWRRITESKGLSKKEVLELVLEQIRTEMPDEYFIEKQINRDEFSTSSSLVNWDVDFGPYQVELNEATQ